MVGVVGSIPIAPTILFRVKPGTVLSSGLFFFQRAVALAAT